MSDTIEHVQVWHDLNRHHKMPKTISELFADARPKVLRTYKENGITVKVYEPAHCG